MEPAFIFGAGSLAKLLSVSIRSSDEYELQAFVVDEEHLDSKELAGRPIIGFEEFCRKFPAQKNCVFVAVGYRRMRSRREIFEKVKELGYKCPNFLFPGARVNEEVDLGEGNIFCDGVIVDSFTRIGDNNFIRSNTYISHDNVFGSHNYVAPGCTFSGNCTVKDLCFFGVGSTVIDGLTVEDETFLSAGSTLLENTEACSQYFGYPAKKVREHKENGIIITR